MPAHYSHACKGATVGCGLRLTECGATRARLCQGTARLQCGCVSIGGIRSVPLDGVLTDWVCFVSSFVPFLHAEAMSSRGCRGRFCTALLRASRTGRSSRARASSPAQGTFTGNGSTVCSAYPIPPCESHPACTIDTPLSATPGLKSSQPCRIPVRGRQGWPVLLFQL